MSDNCSLSQKNWSCSCSSKAQRQAGVGAAVVAELSERAILSLEAPIK